MLRISSSDLDSGVLSKEQLRTDSHFARVVLRPITLTREQNSGIREFGLKEELRGIITKLQIITDLINDYIVLKNMNRLVILIGAAALAATPSLAGRKLFQDVDFDGEITNNIIEDGILGLVEGNNNITP